MDAHLYHVIVGSNSCQDGIYVDLLETLSLINLAKSFLDAEEEPVNLGPSISICLHLYH